MEKDFIEKHLLKDVDGGDEIIQLYRPSQVIKEFFIECLSDEILDNYNINDDRLLSLFKENSSYVYIDDNTMVNSYIENGHTIYVCINGVWSYYGAAEDLIYFITKYCRITRK